MNTHNLPNTAATKTEIPAKRKRGRPRKDDNIIKRGRPQVPITPASEITTKNIQQQQQVVEKVNPNITRIDNNNNIEVGQMVSGVIEGTFDAGYFIAVRVGQSSMILRGVIFQPGRFVPVTPANDIAPHVKMYQREEFGLPVPQNAVQNTKQPEQLVDHSVATMDANANQVLSFERQLFRPPVESTVVPPVLGNKDMSTSLQGGQIAARENLVMVEQDDVMQVFEVSKLSDVSEIDSGAVKNSKQVTNQGSEILKTGMDFEIMTSQLVGPDHGFQEVPSATIVIEPQTSELVHQEFKSTTHGPDHPRSVYCRIKPGELTQHEANNTLLEDVVPLEGTSVSLHAERDNPVEESGVNILIKDGTCCSEKLPLIDDNANCSDELGVEEESSFQGKVDQIQASISAVQTTDMDFVMGDPAAQTTHCGPNDVS